MQDLFDVGFEVVGSWRLSASGLDLTLERWNKVSPALYAFVLDGKVMYVGKTSRSLGNRLYGYLKGAGSQRTNIRVRGKILEALRSGQSIQILGFHNRRPLNVGRFKVNLPAGLEDDIIATLKPPWNGGLRELNPVNLADVTTTEESPPEERRLAHPLPTKTVSAAGAVLKPSFLVTIGKTYFRQGFFNVPVDFERYFAGDGSTATIVLAGDPSPCEVRLNRRVNQNETPRVMGGVKLRDWLHENARIGGQIRVIIHGPTQLEIRQV